MRYLAFALWAVMACRPLPADPSIKRTMMDYIEAIQRKDVPHAKQSQRPRAALCDRTRQHQRHQRAPHRTRLVDLWLRDLPAKGQGRRGECDSARGSVDGQVTDSERRERFVLAMMLLGYGPATALEHLWDVVARNRRRGRS
jgi:hypothetical protein